MDIIRNLKDIPFIEYGALTIGKFDGMHLAHRKVLDTIRKVALREERKFVVISFGNHPFEIIKPNSVPNHLANENFKISYMESIGCDVLILIDFSKVLINTTHIEFLDYILKHFKDIHFVLGYDFKFGKGNIGNINFLRNFCNKNSKIAKITVVKKVEIEDNGTKVSSSLIKKLLKDGNIRKSNYYLNREYYVESSIIKGDRIGSKIGFPTINMYIEKMEYPKDGTYLTKIEIDDVPAGKTFKACGMTYVGRRLVYGFQKEKRLIETFVFNFDNEVYGKNARIYFLKRIRDVIKFDSLESLKKQLIKDKNQCLSIMEEKCH